MEWFAGLHPFIMHFSVGLLPAGLVVLIIYRFSQQEWLLNASVLLFAMSAISLVLAVISGGMVGERINSIPGVFYEVEEFKSWTTIAMWSVLLVFAGTFVYWKFKDSALRFNRDASFLVVILIAVWALAATMTSGSKWGSLVYDYMVAGSVRGLDEESVLRQTNAFYYNKLQFLREQGDIPKIYSLFREIDTALPEDTEFKVMQAKFLFQELNRPDEALVIIDKTMNLIKDPKSQIAYDALVAKYQAYTALSDVSGQESVLMVIKRDFPNSEFARLNN